MLPQGIRAELQSSPLQSQLVQAKTTGYVQISKMKKQFLKFPLKTPFVIRRTSAFVFHSHPPRGIYQETHQGKPPKGQYSEVLPQCPFDISKENMLDSKE